MIFKRIVLGISGGVDSAIAGILLKKRGYDVLGLFMRNWDVKDEVGICLADQDAEDAELVCKQIQIPFYEVNFVKEYWNDVFSYFLETYRSGHTPNPDIYCNKYVKFKCFLNYACDVLGADAIATGHYARTSFGDYLETYDPIKGVRLLKAFDPNKDQTFFLSQIPQAALQKTMFPLGNMKKDVVRSIAKSEGLDEVASKEDSTGICFIGKRDFSSFIEQYIQDRRGDFLDVETKNKVGEHRGVHHWTVGQRAKLCGYPCKYFICSKDVESNTIYVAKGTSHPSLFCNSLHVSPFYWIHSPPNDLVKHGQIECEFRFQHRKPLTNCIVTAETLPNLCPSKRPCRINLETPLRAITPGQFAVIYKGEECLGSAIIARTGPTLFDMHFNERRSRVLRGDE